MNYAKAKVTGDITDRRRVEEAVRESEDRLRLAVESARIGTWDYNPVTGALEWSDRCKAVFGLPPDAEVNYDTFLAGLHPEDRERVHEIVQRALNPASGGEYDVEYRIIGLGDGIERWVAARGRAFFNAAGRAVRFIGTVLDTTEQMRIGAEREQILILERAAREEAEAANRMKDEFLATISHELRTPLTSILGWAHLLSNGMLDEAQRRRAVEVIAQSAKSQAELIEEILDVSCIITGKLRLETRPVEIASVFQHAVELVRPGAEAKEIILHTLINMRSGLVIGDANRLQQAISNLLSNGVKFTPQGGRVEARLERADGQVEITVSDTGVGMESEFLPQAFERFRQADGTSTRKYGGLGLGLAIVRHIVELHGGSVSADSLGKGQGATFKIALPLAPQFVHPTSAEGLKEREGQTEQEREPEKNCLRLDGVYVLLVDDNQVTLDLLYYILSDCGAEVITAASAGEALEKIDRRRPDVLISDIAMPGKDGYELIRELRSREPEHGGRIPAVAITAYTKADARVHALAAGFQSHVPKPVDPDELIAVVAGLRRNIR